MHMYAWVCVDVSVCLLWESLEKLDRVQVPNNLRVHSLRNMRIHVPVYQQDLIEINHRQRLDYHNLSDNSLNVDCVI